jgi:hypothetical protein
MKKKSYIKLFLSTYYNYRGKKCELKSFYCSLLTAHLGEENVPPAGAGPANGGIGRPVGIDALCPEASGAA